ncbi:MAG: GIY-YIG nuclease family protein [Candidatus Omnitrophica bacterium]|nr:GIY-YIG nuclease family protein [Candidatus Omnitrophota bacterium]
MPASPPSVTKGDETARSRHFVKQNDGSANGTVIYYVYILLNEAKTKTYIGVTGNVNKRLAEHNTGRVKSSRSYRPYKVIHTESFETLKEARQKEKFYKSTTGRRRLKKMFF